MKKREKLEFPYTTYKRLFRNIKLLFSTIMLFCITMAEALPPGTDNVEYQASVKNVSGKVTDSSGAPIPGVTVIIEGTTKGVITGMDGEFEIKVNEGDKLQFSFIGMQTQIIPVGKQSVINVTLANQISELEDVTVVAFGKQKKESVLSSITTVKPAELKVPSSNLTTALAGKMSGMISYQRSGEPGEDNAEFFVRGVTTFGYSKSPLILIDGIELSANDLARLQPDDIASFSIMKDATACLLYTSPSPRDRQKSRMPSSA
jgi:hypothetical protein